MTAKGRSDEFRMRRVLAWAFALSSAATFWCLLGQAGGSVTRVLAWLMTPLDCLFFFAMYQIVVFPAALLLVGPPMTLYAWWHSRRNA